MPEVRIALFSCSALAAVCTSACSGRLDLLTGGEGRESGTILAVDARADDVSTNAWSPDADGAATACDGSVWDDGGIAVDAGIIVEASPTLECPIITNISISPAELHPPELAMLQANVQLPTHAGGRETLVWSATCDRSGTPIITNPASLEASFSCGTVIGSCFGEVTRCTLTLTVGIDGTGANGGSVALCTGVAGTTTSDTIACVGSCPVLPGCPNGQTQCGTQDTSDCEDLQGGTGPNGLCGSSCGTAVACPGHCVNGDCLDAGSASEASDAPE